MANRFKNLAKRLKAMQSERAPEGAGQLVIKADSEQVNKLAERLDKLVNELRTYVNQETSKQNATVTNLIGEVERSLQSFRVGLNDVGQQVTELASRKTTTAAKPEPIRSAPLKKIEVTFDSGRTADLVPMYKNGQLSRIDVAFDDDSRAVLETQYQKVN